MFVSRKVAAVFSCLVLVSSVIAGTTDVGVDYLIIVASPLYQKTTVSAAIDTYVNDIKAEGWHPAVITVNNVDDSNADYICPNPDEMKQVIRQYYRKGAKGILLIGSTPAIQTAYWRLGQGNDPADLFYADMADWGTPVEKNVYEPYKPDVSQEDLKAFSPDLFWGRLDAAGISKDIDEEAARIVRYFNKLHQYRVHGSNLPAKAQRHALMVGDCQDYKGWRHAVRFVSPIADTVRGIFDDSLSVGSVWAQALEEGAEYAFLACHTHPTGHVFRAAYDDTIVTDQYFVDDLEKITPRVHFFDLYCCDACRFSYPGDGAIRNLGAMYLFNNDYVLNIAGSTGPWGPVWIDEDYQALVDGKPAGEISLAWFQKRICEDRELGGPKGAFLGDPTLCYKASPVTNQVPRVMSALEGPHDWTSAQGYVDVPFVVFTHDPEGDPVEIEVKGLPSDATLEKGDGYWMWTPKPEDVGKTYKLSLALVESRDGDSRVRYNEDWTIDVHAGTSSPVENGDCEEVAADWLAGWNATNPLNSVAKRDDVVKHSGDASLTLQSDERCEIRVSRRIAVKPFTEYALVAYMRAEDILCERPGEGGAFISFGGFNSQLVSYSTPKGEWFAIVATAKTKAESSVEIGCHLGNPWNPCSGKVWFDDLTLIELPQRELANVGFEESDGGRPIGWAPQSWGFIPEGALSVDSAVKHSGNWSVKMTAEDKKHEFGYCQQIPVKPNSRYRCTAYVKTQGVKEGSGAQIGMQKHMMDPPVLSETLMGDNDWTQAELTFDTGDATEAIVRCRLGEVYTDSLGTAWFDDFTLERVGDTPPKAETKE